MASVLRNACQANGLGTSGSAVMLLNRLISASKKAKTPAASQPKKKKQATPKKKSPVGITKPRKTVPLKSVRGQGVRLSASHYFHEMCDGKISRCKPQVILQPDGKKRLKEIKIVQRGNLKYPQWVNAA